MWLIYDNVLSVDISRAGYYKYKEPIVEKDVHRDLVAEMFWNKTKKGACVKHLSVFSHILPHITTQLLNK